jgi:hypothetical protein
VEAYDAFDYEFAASKFYAAILKDKLYKSALFNFAGLLHMVGYPTLAVFFIEKVLLLDNEDMIAHSFLWALTQLTETSKIGIQTTLSTHSFLWILLIQARYDSNMTVFSRIVDANRCSYSMKSDYLLDRLRVRKVAAVVTRCLNLFSFCVECLHKILFSSLPSIFYTFP